MASSDAKNNDEILNMLDAQDSLDEVNQILTFLQSTLTLSNALTDDCKASLSLSGLYYIFEDAKTRISKAKDSIVELTNDMEPQGKITSDIASIINLKLSPIGYAIAGLREESKHTQIEANELDSIEQLLWSAKAEIIEELQPN